MLPNYKGLQSTEFVLYYPLENFIRQFETILSLNKTTEATCGKTACLKGRPFGRPFLLGKEEFGVDTMPRYSVIEGKNPREICLLRGRGCQWRRCAFCDYHLDFSLDQEANDQLNQQVLAQVDGHLGRLEVINSGSFCDLSTKTHQEIRRICQERKIGQLHFECHWMHRHEIEAIRRFYSDSGIGVTIKMGVETFDYAYREQILRKGIDTASPAEIARYADEVCLLFGLQGQTVESMERDIQTALAYFRRVCVNIMVENSTSIKPDPTVIRGFVEQLYPKYRDEQRVDILLNNTDFGVGA